MGVVNITQDSFSDGGQWLDPTRAVAHAERLLDDGADLLDLGAESSRPGGGAYGQGAKGIAVEEEVRRLIPVLKELRPRTNKPISVDTRKPEVARQALEVGADLINDIDGLTDPEMLDLVARNKCPVVIMHSRGALATMQQDIDFEDVATEVCDELAAAANRAQQAGLSQIILDPGIGFGKSFTHNLELTNQLSRIADLGHPVLFGSSRKGYLGQLTGRPPQRRIAASLASVARVLGSAAIVRVHDVAETVDFLRVWYAHDQPRLAFANSDPGEEPSGTAGDAQAGKAFSQQPFPESGSS